MSMPLTVAGTAAGMASGAANVSPGMPVVTPQGAPIGKVRQIVANLRGEVEQVIVSKGGTLYSIPAGNLAASGNALIASDVSATSKKSTATPPAEKAQ